MTTAAESSSRTIGARLRGVLVVCGVIAVVALVPVMPSQWRGLTHIGQLSSGTAAARAGYVTVEECERGWLLVNWSCTGTYSVADPMAQPYPTITGVRLADIDRYFRRGSRVSVTMARGSHDAYRWGGLAQLRIGAFWLAVLSGAAALGLALARPAARRVTIAALVTAVVAFLAAHPYW